MLHRSILFAAALALAISPNLARAASVKASAMMPSAPAFSNGGFLNVAAYSEEFGVKNEVHFADVTLGGAAAPAGAFREGVGLTSQSIAVPNGTKVSPLTGRIVPNFTQLGPVAQVLGPTGFALNKNQLTSPDDEVRVTSITGDYSAFGAVTNVTNPLINRNFPKYGVSAEADYSGPLPPNPGDSGALAGDPVAIPSGTYPYDPNMSSSINLDSIYEQGGARAYAVDAATFTSDSVDHFVADGEPLSQALWSMVIGAHTPTLGAASMEVDFELNPAALGEITFPSTYLASLGSFTGPADEALLIDQAVDAAALADMSFSGAQASLSDFDPFPSGTTYTPLTDGEAYADGADAAIAGVPEPVGLLQLLLGGAALITRRTRRVRHQYAQEFPED